MTLEALAAPTLDAADDIFDFARPSAEPSSLTTAELASLRTDPAPGWAAARDFGRLALRYLIRTSFKRATVPVPTTVR